MSDLRTTITEVGTGLGMLGFDDISVALATRPPSLTNVDPATWDRLQDAWTARPVRATFEAAFTNGRAFLAARDALRGRTPVSVEWKGAHRSPGDEVIPADLRVDHVYFVSCKYLSRIVVNASPQHVFERLLAGGHGRRTGTDWFDEVAPIEHAALFAAVRAHVDLALPADVRAVTPVQRRALATALRGAWPGSAAERYDELVERVALESARRWRLAIAGAKEAMLWRLLRIGSAPYYVLGAAPDALLRLRIATPWDWRRQFELRAFDIESRPGGQPVVGWHATVRPRATQSDVDVGGHVEVRWSHGRFRAPPEAKVYLDTRHDDIPGYFALE